MQCDHSPRYLPKLGFKIQLRQLISSVTPKLFSCPTTASEAPGLARNSFQLRSCVCQEVVFNCYEFQVIK